MDALRVRRLAYHERYPYIHRVRRGQAALHDIPVSAINARSHQQLPPRGVSLWRCTPGKGGALVHTWKRLTTQSTINVKLIHEGVYRRWLIQRRRADYTILELVERLGTG